MYKTIIGIEIHLEMKTNSKMFSDSLSTYKQKPNHYVNEIDLGYPGALPSINKEGIYKGLLAALLLNCEINKVMRFDRKNYFYPDNSKGFQITQDKTPIGFNGKVLIQNEDFKKEIGVTRIHIEEDTGKSTHNDTYTLLDFNRAGTPLVEIVSEPELASSLEVTLYLEAIRNMMIYANIGDVKLEEGSMRVDVNISVMKKEQKEFNPKTEIKNLNSLSNITAAIDFEIARQIKLIENNEVFEQTTRRYDEVKKETFVMRVKEDASGYRYFQEPDLPVVILHEDDINEVKNSIKETPLSRFNKYLELGIDYKNTSILVNNKPLSDFLNILLNKGANVSSAVSFLLQDFSFLLNKNNLEVQNIDSFDNIVLLLKLRENNEISSKIFKAIYEEVVLKNKNPQDVLKANNIVQINDDSKIIDIIGKILDNNSGAVQDYKDGRDRAIKFLVGQIMKETRGQVDPAKTNVLLLEELKKR